MTFDTEVNSAVTDFQKRLRVHNAEHGTKVAPDHDETDPMTVDYSALLQVAKGLSDMKETAEPYCSKKVAPYDDEAMRVRFDRVSFPIFMGFILPLWMIAWGVLRLVAILD